MNRFEFARPSGIPKDLNKIVVWAIVLRVVLFFIVIHSADPYVLTDDRAYEEMSKTYLLNATSLWDWNAVRLTGGDGYLQVFWPFCICFFTKLMGTYYAGRILNIFLSVLCIYSVYSLTTIITGKHCRGILAAKLMAFMPYPLIFSVFNIKDFYIMYSVLFTFYLLTKWQLGYNVNKRSIILCIVLLVGVYFARGGVVEFIGLTMSLFLFNRYLKEKNYTRMILLGAVVAVAIFYLSDHVVEAFDMKIDTYGDMVLEANGLKMVQIHGVKDIYKLPLQYIFGILSPISLNFFSVINGFTWNKLVSLLNISMYPVGFGCLLYVFLKKHNVIFWLSSFVVFIAITSMVLGISRHYLFLLPFHFINFVCFVDSSSMNQKQIAKYGSIGLFALIFILSLRNII